jgi:hypothetical protein
MTKIAGSGSISQRHRSADPDPYPLQNVMDPDTAFDTIYCGSTCGFGSLRYGTGSGNVKSPKSITVHNFITKV